MFKLNCLIIWRGDILLCTLHSNRELKTNIMKIINSSELQQRLAQSFDNVQQLNECPISDLDAATHARRAWASTWGGLSLDVIIFTGDKDPEADDARYDRVVGINGTKYYYF